MAFISKNIYSFQLTLPPQAALGMEAASFLLPLSALLVWGNKKIERTARPEGNAQKMLFLI
jgi:hypothetical protein